MTRSPCAGPSVCAMSSSAAAFPPTALPPPGAGSESLWSRPRTRWPSLATGASRSASAEGRAGDRGVARAPPLQDQDRDVVRALGVSGEGVDIVADGTADGGGKAS